MVRLDERLQLAADMYEPCEVGADIGTDHALLPCYLLEKGVCSHMLLCDVSPNSMIHAREQVEKRHHEEAVTLVCANGLFALDRPCGCISMTGMGGETMAKILLDGRERIRGAVLVLSAHTEHDLVRRALKELHYHLVREEPCKAAGRWYLVWRAEPGDGEWTENELRWGTPLLDAHPLAGDYYTWKRDCVKCRVDALLAHSTQEDPELLQAQQDLDWLNGRLAKQ